VGFLNVFLLKRRALSADIGEMGRFDKKPVATALLAVAITALTGVLAVIFAQTQQTERVAEAAAQQAEASNAFVLIDSLDSRAEGALITVAAYNAGLTGRTERDQAIRAVTEARDALEASTSTLFNGELAADVDVFIELLESGDTDSARQHLDAAIDPLADARRVQSRIIAQEAVNVIGIETGVAGRWGLVTSFGAGFLAPLLALGVFRAFVNRRRKQDALEQQLIRTKELGQAKDDMIASLSHELRTPLTGLYGFALALEDLGYDDTALAAEMNGYIIRDAADLSRMVDDLLVAAKAENDGLNFLVESVSIERELDEALVSFKRTEKTLIKKVDDEHVLVDRLRVRHVIRNLISNAEKHGGMTITIRGQVDGDRYLLEVIDDGPGVSEEFSARLFERFVHEGDAPLTTGSVGVGLSVAQALAVGMECQVRHEQRANETVFLIDMPLAVSDAPASIPSDDVASLSDGRTESEEDRSPDSELRRPPAPPGPVTIKHSRSIAPEPNPTKTVAVLSQPPPSSPPEAVIAAPVTH
jgi:signal transduction histidine kinase